ncbi:hypothetical protein MUK42_33728, partial [Musa troglodytarum]
SCSGLLSSPKFDCEFSATQQSNPIYRKLTSPLYYLLLLIADALTCPSSSSSSLLGLSACLALMGVYVLPPPCTDAEHTVIIY